MATSSNVERLLPRSKKIATLQTPSKPGSTVYIQAVEVPIRRSEGNKEIVFSLLIYGDYITLKREEGTDKVKEAMKVVGVNPKGLTYKRSEVRMFRNRHYL